MSPLEAAERAQMAEAVLIVLARYQDADGKYRVLTHGQVREVLAAAMEASTQQEVEGAHRFPHFPHPCWPS